MQKPFTKLARLATGAYATRRSVAGGPGHRGPTTDHFDGTMFRNQNPQSTAGRSFGDVLRWQRTGQATRWPKRVENRASPVQWSGPRRVRDPGLAFDVLPRVDVVLVSHSHYDHLDLDTLRRHGVSPSEFLALETGETLRLGA